MFFHAGRVAWRCKRKRRLDRKAQQSKPIGRGLRKVAGTGSRVAIEWFRTGHVTVSMPQRAPVHIGFAQAFRQLATLPESNIKPPFGSAGGLAQFDLDWDC